VLLVEDKPVNSFLMPLDLHLVEGLSNGLLEVVYQPTIEGVHDAVFIYFEVRLFSTRLSAAVGMLDNGTNFGTQRLPLSLVCWLTD
jgi:hypothetical protein